MTTFLLSGANGATAGGWHAELARLRPEIDGSGGLVNLSMAASGPLSALAQAALARSAKPGDLFIWDHADSLLGCVKDGAYDPVEAVRVVEMFLRGCARRKIQVAPLISERLTEAISVEIEEVTLRLMHLFERFSLPTLSMTAELRASLGARELRPNHFVDQGAVYSNERPVKMHLARAVAEHTKSVERMKRSPQQRGEAVYSATKGVLRAALPSNAGALDQTRAVRASIGPVEAEMLVIAPGGSVEFDVEGELLGFAAVIGPDEGIVKISVDSEGFDDLRATPVSLWSPSDAAMVGQISVTHLMGRRATLNFPTRVVVRNISADVGSAKIRADHGAAPPTTLTPTAEVRLLAMIERRPHQHAPPDAANAEAATAKPG